MWVQRPPHTPEGWEAARALDNGAVTTIAQDSLSKLFEGDPLRKYLNEAPVTQLAGRGWGVTQQVW